MKTALIVILVLRASAFAAAPFISGVANSAGNQPVIASGTWVSIYGTNLASSTRQWASADFNGSNLPTKLDDVQVSVNTQPAYVYVISPTQINILCPDDPATGQVNVQVMNAQGTSNQFKVTKQIAAPAFFAYGAQGGKYAIAQSTAYQLLAPPGLLGASITTARAKKGQSVILYATGLGATQPALPSGQVVTTGAPLASPVQITFDGQPAQVQYAGLIGSGLYQINVAVPTTASGDTPIALTAGGQTANSILAVETVLALDPALSAPPLIGCVSGQVDSITYGSARLSYSQADEVSIGGTLLCATCTVKPPQSGEFTSRLEIALRRRKNVEACYDSTGQIYQLLVSQP